MAQLSCSTHQAHLKHMRKTTDDVLLRASEREWISSRQGKSWLKEMNRISDEPKMRIKQLSPPKDSNRTPDSRSPCQPAHGKRLVDVRANVNCEFKQTT